MDNNINYRNSTSDSTDDHAAKMKASANDLLDESKKLANDLYKQGVNKVSESVSDAEECIQAYSDTLVKKIQSNPLSSVLVAVGMGVLLSAFFKK